MDPDDFDFEDFELPTPDDPPTPDYRATVVGSEVTVIPCNPSALFTGGPTGAIIRAREDDGVTVVDLCVSGELPDREVSVTFLARGGGRRAEKALVDWAAATGYRRIWFPARVVPLEPAGELGGARTTCPRCQAEWRDGGQRFWAGVRRRGLFPTWCMVCGGDLPQWKVRRRRRSRDSDAGKAADHGEHSLEYAADEPAKRSRD